MIIFTKEKKSHLAYKRSIQRCNAQYNNADRALCELGDFILRPEWVRHPLMSSVWIIMTELQQERAVEAYFKLLITTPTSTTTNGTYTIPTTPGRGRKLKQRQHARDRALLSATNQTMINELYSDI